MAKAFICDVTGKLVEGVPVSEIEIPVSDEIVLVIHPMKILPSKNRIPAELSPEVVEAIRKGGAMFKAQFGSKSKLSCVPEFQKSRTEAEG